MLKKIIIYKYRFCCETGLHIGGGKDNFDIGGADATVIKDPLTNIPYIPGSSLKGKIRSLLNWKYGNSRSENSESEAQKIIDMIFGSLKQVNCINVTRLVFRDCFLTESAKKELEDKLGKNVYTEIKAENSIDHLKGKAIAPRWIERIPAGAEFEAEIVLNIFENDNEEVMEEMLQEGVEMLQYNYLGGNGSRGYGKIVMVEKKRQEVNYENN